jgi:hypothetical protein
MSETIKDIYLECLMNSKNSIREQITQLKIKAEELNGGFEV